MAAWKGGPEGFGDWLAGALNTIMTVIAAIPTGGSSVAASIASASAMGGLFTILDAVLSTTLSDVDENMDMSNEDPFALQQFSKRVASNPKLMELIKDFQNQLEVTKQYAKGYNESKNGWNAVGDAFSKFFTLNLYSPIRHAASDYSEQFNKTQKKGEKVSNELSKEMEKFNNDIAQITGTIKL